MQARILTVNDGLGSSSRFSSIVRSGERISAAEVGMLLGMGVCATALSAFVKLNLGIPGHNIIRVVFPMALGMALVPRRGSASIMGLGALLSAPLFVIVGRSLGVGAITSLLLTGFLIDLALLGAKPGRSLYFRLALAGVSANLVAMLMRGGSKFLAGGQIDGRPLAIWLPEAAFTYPACGALAGLVSAAIWFRFAVDRPAASDSEVQA